MRTRSLFLLVLIIFSPASWAESEIFMCPMHPHILGEEGGSCPICGMTLVPKISTTDKTGEGFSVAPRFVQSLGVKVSPVKHERFGKVVRAYGRILPNQRLTHEVTVREEAWVHRLVKNAEGDIVKTGDLLFELYSPAILGAQSDYLIAKKEGRLGRYSEQQLRLVGMDDKAIALFKKQNSMMEVIPVHAPRNGVITMLHVSEGGYLEKGAQVITLQDFSQLWVDASLPQRDLQFISPGTSATILLPETGEQYSAKIDHIHPMNDAKSLTATVRLHVDNSNSALRPESYAEVIFESTPHQRLAVPAEALLHDAQGAYVIEHIGNGFFKSLRVERGISAHGITEITNGLTPGQKVVVSGQFLLDAESRLRGAMGTMTQSEDGAAVNTHADENTGVNKETRHVH